MLIHILRNNTFFITQWQFIFHLHFSNQSDFDLKSISQEFLLFLKSLIKHSIFDNGIMTLKLKQKLKRK